MRKKVRKVAVAVVLLVVVASLGVSIFLQGYTLCEWWKPALRCALIGIVAGIALHRRMSCLTGTDNALLNRVATFVLAYSIASGCFYAANYCLSDTDSRQNYSALVVNKYSKERYRTKRVSRHTAVGGEKYHVYYIDIMLPDGRTKQVRVPTAEYVKLRKGQQINLSIENGLLGIPVIRCLRFPVEKPKRF